MLSLIFLILGVFIDSAALIVMLVPVTTPICEKFGINPLHIGLVTTYSIMLGLITPPVAMALFISGTIAKVPIEKVFRASLPLFAVCVGVLFLVAFFEEIWMWVPALIGYLE